MNKLGKVFIALFITTSFASCTSDDNPVNDTLGTIAGNWNITSLDYQGETLTEFSDETISRSFHGIGQNFNASIVFTENPNEYIDNGSYEIVETVNETGIGETTALITRDFQFEGAWNRNQNTISFDGEPSFINPAVPVSVLEVIMNDANIVELTETTLRLRQDISQIISQNQTTINFTLSSEVVLTRQ